MKIIIRKFRFWILENINDILIISIGLLIAIPVYFLLWSNFNANIRGESMLNNILTINGVFSAILITYLFTRITWTKDDKKEAFKEASSLSQKITEFRRVLRKLTEYYQVWDNDDQTKNLIDHGRFNRIDFYDYRKKSISDYIPPNADLIDELSAHRNFTESKTTLYLAMVSLVRNRHANFDFQEELYTDFDYQGTYALKWIEKWVDCDIFGIISTRLSRGDNNWIRYGNLSVDSDAFISAAATRFNIKYKDKPINNELIASMADDIDSYYIKELYQRTVYLEKGITDLNMLLMILIFMSLLFGVLIPFIQILTLASQMWCYIIIKLIFSINIFLITYFILKFPFLIKKELKWI